VLLRARCPRCRRETPIQLAAAGDAAVGEGVAGALRADVLVTRGGSPALAFEVRVTHAIDAGKEAALAAAGVPTIEIDARAQWEREEEEGTAIVPARALGFPRCAACTALARADVDRARGGEAAEIAELEAYRARGLFGPTAPGREDLHAAARGFRCPDCRSTDVVRGERILRHACPGGASRPLAWVGYDGAIVSLGWWRRPARQGE
jgi:hypothetical protein